MHQNIIVRISDRLKRFDAKDARCIEESQACFIDSTWRNLAYIQSNFSGLSRAITKLEKQGLPIYDALEIFANVRNEMDAAIGEIADQIRNKFNNVVSSNIGLETIAQICQILSGHDTECNIPPDLIPYYKYAPITSVDVERSFSVYKSILADNRMKFTPKNLEMYLICNFNLS
uniref:Uncharacterized protein n=1 Tax=Meloidogyne incognita TaxID=6306 RepID=A0A914M3A4_MELIC